MNIHLARPQRPGGVPHGAEIALPGVPCAMPGFGVVQKIEECPEHPGQCFRAAFAPSTPMGKAAGLAGRWGLSRSGVVMTPTGSAVRYAIQCESDPKDPELRAAWVRYDQARAAKSSLVDKALVAAHGWPVLAFFSCHLCGADGETAVTGPAYPDSWIVLCAAHAGFFPGYEPAEGIATA